VCGRGIEEIGREPDVHHITPVATFHKHPDYSKSDAHYVANLVSLCRRHHRMVEEERNLLLDRLNSSLLDQLEIGNPPGLDDN
jgi:predicted HNH restriction endonuclease